jgi:hypothetical protein
MRRHLAWPLALPIAVIGGLAAHSVGYRVAVPDPRLREEVLASSGHGYLDYAPLAVGLCTAVVLLAFAAGVLRSFFGRGGRGVQIKLLAGLPPLAFVTQEILERLVHDGHVQPSLLWSAPFVVGLAAQLPFALLAAAIAYALGGAAERLGRAIRAAGRPRLTLAFLHASFLVAADLAPRPVLARGYAGRGPPLRFS